MECEKATEENQNFKQIIETFSKNPNKINMKNLMLEKQNL